MAFPPLHPNSRTTNTSLIALWRDRVPAPKEILWSGSYAQLDGGGLFDSHPRTWTQHGWSALQSACDHALAHTADPILIRPHARHILSDIPSLKRFAAERPAGFRLILDPCSMLDTAHLEHHSAQDTLRRILEEVPHLGIPIAGIVAANITADLRLVPLDDGILDPAFLRTLFSVPC